MSATRKRKLSELFAMLAEAHDAREVGTVDFGSGLCYTLGIMAGMEQLTFVERYMMHGEIMAEVEARHAGACVAYHGRIEHAYHIFTDPDLTPAEAKEARVLAALLFSERARSERR